MDRLDDAEDKRLMAALASGDELALNRLVARWQGPLRQFVFRHVQHEADTEDLLQDVFVRVYRHRARYEPRSRFSTWLFTIAVNLCRNHTEKARRRVAVSLDASPADPSAGDHGSGRPARDAVDTGADPAVSVLAVERATAVREAIGDLPEDLRTAVLLFEYQGLSHTEIATIVGATPKAVETRLYRARAILRERLGRWLRA